MRAAVIDLGSNALRLQIVEVAGAAPPVVLERQRAPVRLGRAVFVEGPIHEDSVAAAEEALRGFAALCEQYGVQHARAVATSALREATNRDAVVARLSAVSPAPVEVISGMEEARLLVLAVETRVDLGEGRSLLVDLGGGSAELTLVVDGRTAVADSLPLGSVRLLEQVRRQAADGSPDFAVRLKEHVARAHPRVSELLGGRAVDRLVVCGGSAETLLELASESAGGAAESTENLECTALERCVRELASVDPGERAQRFDLPPDRADVVLPAAVVLLELAAWAGVRRLLVPRVGLRDGLQRELIEAAQRRR